MKHQWGPRLSQDLPHSKGLFMYNLVYTGKCHINHHDIIKTSSRENRKMHFPLSFSILTLRSNNLYNMAENYV